MKVYQPQYIEPYEFNVGPTFSTEAKAKTWIEINHPHSSPWEVVPIVVDHDPDLKEKVVDYVVISPKTQEEERQTIETFGFGIENYTLVKDSYVRKKGC